MIPSSVFPLDCNSMRKDNTLSDRFVRDRYTMDVRQSP